MNPPILMMRCCKKIVGCEACVNSWFNGQDALTKCCPCCRAERGYNETMRLRGLDDFLGQVKQLYKDEDSLEDGV